MRRIAVITGTRAEYGLLYCLLKILEDDPRIELQLVVTGTHLSAAYGSTADYIKSDGFKISANVDMKIGDDSPIGICRSMGLAVSGFGEVFDRLRPDLIVVLGDRYEIFSAAQAAMISKVPIAHVHGGEATEGLIDEAIRHSLTKMSHLHFVASEAYRQRVIQLGESPSRVFNVGAPALDNIADLEVIDRSTLESEIDFSFGDRLFLVTYHPVTLEDSDATLSIDRLLAVLNEFRDAQILFTGVNADTQGHIIKERIDAYTGSNQGRVKSVESLGRIRYLNAMRYASVVLGNSSSGLIEAPAMGVPTVNIGLRQQGRLRAPSVLDCADKKEDIKQAIVTVLQDEFIAKSSRCETPYGKPGASKSIAEIVASYPLDNLIVKQFHDLPQGGD